MLYANILLVVVVAVLAASELLHVRHIASLHATRLSKLDTFQLHMDQHRQDSNQKFIDVEKNVDSRLKELHDRISGEQIVQHNNLSRALHNGQLQLEQVKASIKLLAEEIGSIQNQLRRL